MLTFGPAQKCSYCLPRGSLMPSQDRISLLKAQGNLHYRTESKTLGSKIKSSHCGLVACQQNISPPVRQFHVMPHIAMKNTKNISPHTLQNICQVDAHLWRNWLFLHEARIHCKLNTSEVPDMAAFANELLFILCQSFLLHPHPKQEEVTWYFQVNSLPCRWNDN